MMTVAIGLVMRTGLHDANNDGPVTHENQLDCCELYQMSGVAGCDQDHALVLFRDDIFSVIQY